MMTEEKKTIYISYTVAARRTGVSPRTIRRYIRRGLVAENLTEEQLKELRRIRRLTQLGINLAGVEVVLHMRRQVEELRAELDRLRNQMQGPGGPR
jgi:MerR family transcriptional regulator/heat shock protein HspR